MEKGLSLNNYKDETCDETASLYDEKTFLSVQKENIDLNADSSDSSSCKSNELSAGTDGGSIMGDFTNISNYKYAKTIVITEDIVESVNITDGLDTRLSKLTVDSGENLHDVSGVTINTHLDKILFCDKNVTLAHLSTDNTESTYLGKNSEEKPFTEPTKRFSNLESCVGGGDISIMNRCKSTCFKPAHSESNTLQGIQKKSANDPSTSIPFFTLSIKSNQTDGDDYIMSIDVQHQEENGEKDFLDDSISIISSKIRGNEELRTTDNYPEITIPTDCCTNDQPTITYESGNFLPAVQRKTNDGSTDLPTEINRICDTDTTSIENSDIRLITPQFDITEYMDSESTDHTPVIIASSDKAEPVELVSNTEGHFVSNKPASMCKTSYSSNLTIECNEISEDNQTKGTLFRDNKTGNVNQIEDRLLDNSTAVTSEKEIQPVPIKSMTASKTEEKDVICYNSNQEIVSTELEEKITIGIKAVHSLLFNVTSHLLGVDGENVNFICKMTGSLILLRGKGSFFIEADGKESEEPLHFYVKYKDKKSMSRARHMILNLIMGVQKQFSQAYGYRYNWTPVAPKIFPVNSKIENESSYPIQIKTSTNYTPPSAPKTVMPQSGPPVISGFGNFYNVSPYSGSMSPNPLVQGSMFMHQAQMIPPAGIQTPPVMRYSLPMNMPTTFPVSMPVYIQSQYVAPKLELRYPLPLTPHSPVLTRGNVAGFVIKSSSTEDANLMDQVQSSLLNSNPDSKVDNCSSACTAPVSVTSTCADTVTVSDVVGNINFENCGKITDSISILGETVGVNIDSGMSVITDSKYDLQQVRIKKDVADKLLEHLSSFTSSSRDKNKTKPGTIPVTENEANLVTIPVTENNSKPEIIPITECMPTQNDQTQNQIHENCESCLTAHGNDSRYHEYGCVPDSTVTTDPMPVLKEKTQAGHSGMSHSGREVSNVQFMHCWDNKVAALKEGGSKNKKKRHIQAKFREKVGVEEELEKYFGSFLSEDTRAQEKQISKEEFDDIFQSCTFENSQTSCSSFVNSKSKTSLKQPKEEDIQKYFSDFLLENMHTDANQITNEKPADVFQSSIFSTQQTSLRRMISKPTTKSEKYLSTFSFENECVDRQITEKPKDLFRSNIPLTSQTPEHSKTKIKLEELGRAYMPNLSTKTSIKIDNKLKKLDSIRQFVQNQNKVILKRTSG